MLVYDGHLSAREFSNYYPKNQKALVRLAKRHATELTKERKVIFTDILPLGETEVIEYRQDITNGFQQYSIATSVFKEMKSGQTFALVLSDYEYLRFGNLNEEWDYKRAHKKPSTWEGTPSSDLSVILIVPTKKKENVVVVHKCENLPDALKEICVADLLINIEIIGGNCVEDVIYPIGGSHYSLGLLLFSYKEILYMKSELLCQHSGARQLVEQAFVTKLATR